MIHLRNLLWSPSRSSSSFCALSVSARARLAVLSCALVGSASGLAACSDNATGGTSGTVADAGGGADSGGEADSGGKVDAGDSGKVGIAVNRCTTFVDRSAAGASRTLTWDFPIAQAPERCLTIKKGQEVTFSGDFNVHPLAASGGDSPNPIASATAGKATFTAAGTFGFICGVHPAMNGAINVIE